MKCPQSEILLEFVSIPDEMSRIKRMQLRSHMFLCAPCQSKVTSLRKGWSKFLVPEPDVTSSLMRVYSRLQKDETLILKGWKFGETVPRRNMESILLKEGWLFRGMIGVGLTVAIALVLHNQQFQRNTPTPAPVRHTPLAQIRVEGKNNVKVHYLEPELLQTVEFETASSR
jgi:hypothetical protein